MARELGMNTQRLQFLRETMERETLTRLRWRERFLFPWTSMWNTFKLKTPTHPLEPVCLQDPPGRRSSLEHLSDATARKAPGKDPKEDPQPKEEIPPEMRPITPETQMLLFRGVYGRQDYLKKRLEKSPEKKFDFPMLSSWEYGWKQGGWGWGEREIERDRDRDRDRDR
uniref:Sperm microtubule inner protein 1 C-terminal domain-containing protein n=1 Tax=Eptatretus burgeri TaxID=7764 RepID=A0A8C4QR17_EPTBU